MMAGPGQDISGKDGFGDKPYQINEVAKDDYPIMGNQIKQISVTDKSLSPEDAKVGDSIAVMAKLRSKYALSQVAVHAFQSGKEAKGYARLVLSDDSYKGTFPTALLDPGRYDIVLSARDSRGYELQETLGSITVRSRSGFAS